MNDNMKQIEVLANIIGDALPIRSPYGNLDDLIPEKYVLGKQIAERLYLVGYRKQSETDINRLIIENKKKLDDAMRDSLNIAMGERNIDIKQAWDNGYSKGKSDTVKELEEMKNGNANNKL